MEVRRAAIVTTFLLLSSYHKVIIMCYYQVNRLNYLRLVIAVINH